MQNNAVKPGRASVIIRAKNEEKWISQCLKSVFKQKYDDIEVVVVDNNSTDQTIERCKHFPVKIISIDKFIPGEAINRGIAASSGEFIVCLSGHCIPVDDYWLKNLIEDLADPEIAGVYGRQQPLSYTSDLDKRDLITVFGLDKKVQIKDPFFHNANSAFTRKVWNKFPFDESVTNIEDRVWGQQVISAGYKLIYRPDASVFHWHGINHSMHEGRARGIVRILEGLDESIKNNRASQVEDLNIVAIIPVRGPTIAIEGCSLIDFTIDTAQKCKLIKEIFVITDNEEYATHAKLRGAKAPFLRPKELSEDYVDVTDVLKFAIEKIGNEYGIIDLVVILEEIYPFRSSDLIENIIRTHVERGLDSLVPCHRELRGIWIEKDGKKDLIGDGLMPSKLKDSVALIGMVGLG